MASLTVLTAFAAGPELTRLDPPGGRRGSALKIIVEGYGLNSEAKVHSTLPGSFTALASAKQGMGQGLPFLVEIAADAPIALYPVRVETEQGLSNILLFSVGAFPEVGETEGEDEDKNTNDEPENAQAIETPVIVNAALEGAERDVYRFHARAGQRLVFEVEGRRAGSALDPALRVFDGRSRVIARNNDAAGLGVDPRAAVTFEAAGEYFVEVHDARFSEQDQNFYRLKIGDFAYAEAIVSVGLDPRRAGGGGTLRRQLRATHHGAPATGRTRADGGLRAAADYSPPIRFDVVEGYRIEPAVEVTSIQPGGTTEFAGRVSREPEFTSSVNLSVQNLPLGVECEEFELGAQDTEYRLPCRADDAAEPGEYETELISRATLAGPGNTRVPYRVSPVKTRLVVAGSKKPTERASR